MSDNESKNKRIAQNTILLYVRMIVTMFVGLFTSRIVLDALGVEDYGIYNVVGGFVSMFTIVRSGLVSSTQRFITFNLGKGDIKELNRTFSTITFIYLFLCIVVFVVAELVGGWFIENKLTIPVERLGAAKWVFQFSLFTLIVTLLSNSYNSLIIAHERMNAFAYITIYEVVVKLVVAYILLITTCDKLVVYAVLLCVVQGTVPILYFVYCHRHFKEEIKLRWTLDWKKVGEIYSFAGWSMLGGVANIGYTQGLNILLGLFFTPVVNAARGVAVQVQGLLAQFVTNFQMAIDPQIIKSYARCDYDYTSKLVFSSSRFSFYLLLLISLPVLFEAETLLGWWLVEVPKDTPLFLRLIIIITMYDAISNPYGKVIHATGKIRDYQLVCSGLLIMIVPISYFVLKIGSPAYTVFIVHILIGFLVMVSRIWIAERKALKNSMVLFISSVGIKIIMVTLVSIVAPMIAYIYVSQVEIRFFVVSIVCVLSVILCVFTIGITKEEQRMVVNKISLYLSK